MASGIGPEGDGLKKALRWLSDRRRDDPEVPRTKLIEEAGTRFDLTPLELQFLYDNWK
jgi:hypothetical protein